MKRQSLIYFIMLLVAAAGVWAVMRVGARLDAAADLGGDWTFDAGGPLGPETDGPERLGKGFHIDQSGQFLRVTFENGRQLDLRAEQLPQGAIGATPMPVELGDGRWHLGGSVRQENGKLIGAFTLKGPENARFVAYRAPPETEKPPVIAPKLPAPTADATPNESTGIVSAPAMALAADKTPDASAGLPVPSRPARGPARTIETSTPDAETVTP